MRKETNSPERELRTFRIYFFIPQTTINRNRNGVKTWREIIGIWILRIERRSRRGTPAGIARLEIAARLGVHTATIYHELQRGYTGEVDAAQREVYSAERAQAVVRENFKRRGRRAVTE